MERTIPMRDAWDALPMELRDRPQWVVWRAEEREGKSTKVPWDVGSIRNGDSHRAKTNDPNTWSDFTTACELGDTSGLSGIGYVFAETDPYVGVDLDHVIDDNGTLSDRAAGIVSALDSYTEVSPGGRGLHILIRGTLAKSVKTEEVEVYASGRYFTVTGNVYGGHNVIGERNAELERLVDELRPAPVNRQGTPAPALSDDEIMGRAAAENSRFQTLYSGVWRNDYASASEADLALVSFLSQWTGPDETTVDRLFRKSGLFRTKWDEPHDSSGRTYGEMTIDTCLKSRDWDDSTSRPHSNPADADAFQPLLFPEPANDPLPPLPDICVPPALAPWLNDVARRMDVPRDFPTGAAVVGIASLIGRRASIHPKRHDDWAEYGNLWGALVAEPGELKSPAVARALFPLRDLEGRARQIWNEEALILRGKLKIAQEREKVYEKAYKKALEHQPDEAGEFELRLAEVHTDILKLRQELRGGGDRRITNDATTEKLAEICSANPYGLLVLRDELAGHLETLEKAGREGDREFYLESWSGDGEHSYDRIGRGAVYVPHLCLGIFGTIQPGKLAALITSACEPGRGADGLLQRYQVLLYPDRRGPRQWIDEAPDLSAREQYASVFNALASSHWITTLGLNDLSRGLHMGSGPATSPVYDFNFDDAAQAASTAWLIELERKISSQTSTAFKAHLSKYRGLMPRFALNYFLMEASVSSVVNRTIGIEAVRYATAWCEHLELHARKLWAPALIPESLPSRELAVKIRQRRIDNGTTLRDIQQANWTGLKTTEAVESAAELLQKWGWLTIYTQQTGGRPSRRVRVNPDLDARIRQEGF